MPEIQVKYATNKIYYEKPMDAVLKWAGITDRSMYIEKTVNEMCGIMNDCINNNIPVFLFCSGYYTDKRGVPTCGHCRAFARDTLTNSTFIDYIRNNTKCVFLYGDDCAIDYAVAGFKNFFYACGHGTKTPNGINYGTYVIGAGCWKKPDGTFNRFAKSTFTDTNDSSSWVNNVLAKTIDTLTNGFTAA